MRVRFFKRNFEELVLHIEADDDLGKLRGENILDYFGTGSQVTLHHLESKVRYSVGVSADDSGRIFEGSLPLDVLEVGYYQLEGAVADPQGNVAILSTFHEPLDAAHQRTITLGLEVIPGFGIVPVYRLNARLAGPVELTGRLAPTSMEARGRWRGPFEANARYPTEIDLRGGYQKEFSL